MSRNTPLKNATVLVYGSSLLVIIANALMWRHIPYERMPVIPGFSELGSISWALLFFWAGLVIQQAWSNVKWWIRVPVLVLVLGLFFLCRFVSFDGWSTTAVPNLYACLFCLGFISPTDTLVSLKDFKGWYILFVVSVLAFCFVAISVTAYRLHWWDVFQPEFADMQRLLRWLTRTAEPLLLILVTVLIAAFAFTQAGQWLGRRKCIKWVAVVASAVVFLPGLVNIIGWYHHWYFVSRFLAQPVNVYLVVVLYRKLAVRTDRGEKLSWKEAFRVFQST